MDEQYQHYLAARRRLLANDPAARPTAEDVYDAISSQATQHRWGLGVAAEGKLPAAAPSGSTLRGAAAFQWCRGEHDRDSAGSDEETEGPTRDRRYWRKYRWRQLGDDSEGEEEGPPAPEAPSAPHTKVARGGKGTVTDTGREATPPPPPSRLQWRSERRKADTASPPPSTARRLQRSPSPRRSPPSSKRRRRSPAPVIDREAVSRSAPRRAEDVPGYLSMSLAEKIQLKMRLRLSATAPRR